MQVEGTWKVAANLNLLLGTEHPPARVEKPLLTPQQRAISGSAGVVVVDARNTANFRSSSYCGLQEKSTPSVRRNVVAYYQDMLRRIPLWRSSSNVKKQEEGDDEQHYQGATVKPEPSAEEGGDEGGVDDDLHAPVPQRSTAPGHGAAPLFRAVGILTQVHETSTASAATQQAPWEFYVIRDLEDEDSYVRTLQAMTRQTTATGAFLLLQEGQGTNNDRGKEGSNGNGMSARTSGRLSTSESPRPSVGAMANIAVAGEETTATKAEADEEAATQDGTRLSLYTRQVRQFTGLYPGMAVGVVGEPFQRTARGVLTGVLVRDFILPSRPVLPWRVDRPLPAYVNALTSEAGSARIHFCSGPFPRRDVSGLLRAVTQQALHRGADVLIIGGPFIPPFTNEFERGLLPSLGATFNEVMESFVDTLEETLKQYYATRPLLPHLKVLLVSHRGDVMQVPVLPTTMYAIADTDDILVRSNPCRLSVNGVHVSVCNEDVVGAMRERMVERWPSAEGSLRRVVEALVDGRLYTPLYHFPVTTADMKHLPQLRMDYVPARNELLDIEAAPASTPPPPHGVGDKKRTRDEDGALRPLGEHGGEGVAGERSWDAVLQLNASSDAVSTKTEVKRAKSEPASEDASGPERALTAFSDATRTGAAASTAAEYMPHIMFLPSTRPHFAVVTHQSEEVDGPDVDNTAQASGVLVVNQEVWSTRSSPKFQLRVAEVTIPNTALVLRRGATAANGVACGVLHIYAA